MTDPNLGHGKVNRLLAQEGLQVSEKLLFPAGIQAWCNQPQPGEVVLRGLLTGHLSSLQVKDKGGHQL